MAETRRSKRTRPQPQSPWAILKDERGAILVYVSIALVAFFGLAGLAVEASRLVVLQSELQSAADGFALAGAVELNGESGARDRATDAITSRITDNEQDLAGGDPNVVVPVANIRFLSSLPPDDQPITASHEATSDSDAIFVEVTVEPRGFDIGLLRVVGAADAVQTDATAVAGYEEVICQFTPIFMCDPFATENVSVEDIVNSPNLKKRQFKFKHKSGNNAQYFAGDFGFLDTLTGAGGANALRDEFAQVSPVSCVSRRGVTIHPGNIASIAQGLNVRFDMYSGPFNSLKSDPNYRPAENVTKGYTGAICNPQPESDPTIAVGLPRDTAYPFMNGRWGNGSFNLSQYWETNHGSPTLPPELQGANTTRYEVYRYEIENNMIPDNSPAGENGNPTCYSGGVLNDTPDRRELFVAVLDCSEINTQGASGGPFPVETYAEIFISEPMVQGEDELIGEFVDIAEPGDQPLVFKQRVRLYR